MQSPLDALIHAAIRYDHGDPARIQHFIKVHAFAKLIAEGENLSASVLLVLEPAAILHDIGIHAAEEKYGSSAGKYQEQEGPAIAEKMLHEVGGFTDRQIERILFLIGHHHTYQNIEGEDWQVLVEADFLVNLYEDHASRDTAQNVRDSIFKTETGKELVSQMFDLA